MALYQPNATIVSTKVNDLPATLSLTLGATSQLSATAVATLSDGSTQALSVKYETDNQHVATVSPSGLVTATAGTGSRADTYVTKGGRATISAQAVLPNGAPIGTLATCVVTVQSTIQSPRPSMSGNWGASPAASGGLFRADPY